MGKTPNIQCSAWRFWWIWWIGGERPSIHWLKHHRESMMKELEARVSDRNQTSVDKMRCHKKVNDLTCGQVQLSVTKSHHPPNVLLLNTRQPHHWSLLSTDETQDLNNSPPALMFMPIASLMPIFPSMRGLSVVQLRHAHHVKKIMQDSDTYTHLSHLGEGGMQLAATICSKSLPANLEHKMQQHYIVGGDLWCKDCVVNGFIGQAIGKG